MNREELMCVLEDAISELSYKITEGRIVDADREKVRLKQYRVLTSMISEYRRNLQDEDLEELAEKVDLTNRQVLNVLRMLEKQDVIRSEDKDGRSLWWSDVDVESIEHGNFEIGKSPVIETIIMNFPIPDDLEGQTELQPSSESVSEQTGADPPPKASD